MHSMGGPIDVILLEIVFLSHTTHICGPIDVILSILLYNTILRVYGNTGSVTKIKYSFYLLIG